MSSRTYDELALPFLASIYPPVLQSIDLLVELIDKQCKDGELQESEQRCTTDFVEEERTED